MLTGTRLMCWAFSKAWNTTFHRPSVRARQEAHAIEETAKCNGPFPLPACGDDCSWLWKAEIPHAKHRNADAGIGSGMSLSPEYGAFSPQAKYTD
jgi:hypothetical protein